MLDMLCAFFLVYILYIYVPGGLIFTLMSTGITITKKDVPKEKTRKAIDDEEFEEFPVQEWAERTDDADDEEMNVWEDNWDDETHESDFSKQLK
ncbi:unnamed protein product [Strongylus vulgaris]|uniref:26S proteasome complex subunit dss-1 n=1 Tax=Strongylus vulgaris TaxID=40348 RepID=A0A3P7HXZ5_STRVU|nr:unnamed protein product [Strongylus vulgaris]